MKCAEFDAKRACIIMKAKTFGQLCKLSVGKHFFVALAAMAAVNMSRADSPIALNTWYDFGFGGAGTFATNGLLTYGPIGTVQAPDPAWAFTSASTTDVYLTDAYSQGDSFSLFDNGLFVGSTPAVPSGFGTTDDPQTAFNDPTYSHGIFALAPGAHALTIRVDNSPFSVGGAYFEVVPVPEPTTFSLVGVMLISVAGLSLRRGRAPAGHRSS
jgi:hypothetical protein